MTRRGAGRGGLRPLRRALAGVEAAQVRRWGSSVLGRVAGTPVLVLETVGRRTGRRRSTVLARHRLDDGRLVVVGGAGGQAVLPDWVANLRSEPRAVAVVGRRRVPVVAEELAGAARAEVWRQALVVWPRIARYEARAGRPVPVFVLHGRSGDPGGGRAPPAPGAGA